MMNASRIVVLSLIATAGLAATACATSPMEDASALIGIVYTTRMPSGPIAARPFCTHEGGGMLVIDDAFSDEWAFASIDCRGRTIIALQRFVEAGDGHVTWHILDTLLLPPYQNDYVPDQPHALRLFDTENCELDGRQERYFIALVRWGERDRIDWRTGVEQAWDFDVARGRIVPLSPKRVVCYRPDPP